MAMSCEERRYRKRLYNRKKRANQSEEEREARNVYNRAWRKANPEKTLEQARKSNARSYAKNPEVYLERTKARYWQRREWLNEQKSGPCVECKTEYPPRVMDFHHRDPSTKSFQVGMGRGNSKERLVAEIAKCDLLCANCHRLREAGLI